MPNITAVGSDGISIVFIKASGDGGENNPFVPVSQLEENTTVLVEGGNSAPVLVQLVPQLNGFATEQTALNSATLLANINNKFPVLINGRVPVEVSSLNLNLVQADLQIANTEDNPVPVQGFVSVYQDGETSPFRVRISNPTEFSSFRTQTLTSTPVLIKSGAGGVHGFNFINVNTESVYVKFFDKEPQNITVGVDEPKLIICVPPGEATVPGIHATDPNFIAFEDFDVAISIAAMDDIADTSTSSPTAAIYAFVRYR